MGVGGGTVPNTDRKGRIWSEYKSEGGGSGPNIVRKGEGEDPVRIVIGRGRILSEYRSERGVFCPNL